MRFSITPALLILIHYHLIATRNHHPDGAWLAPSRSDQSSSLNGHCYATAGKVTEDDILHKPGSLMRALFAAITTLDDGVRDLRKNSPYLEIGKIPGEALILKAVRRFDWPFDVAKRASVRELKRLFWYDAQCERIEAEKTDGKNMVEVHMDDKDKRYWWTIRRALLMVVAAIDTLWGEGRQRADHDRLFVYPLFHRRAG